MSDWNKGWMGLCTKRVLPSFNQEGVGTSHYIMQYQHNTKTFRKSSPSFTKSLLKFGVNPDNDDDDHDDHDDYCYDKQDTATQNLQMYKEIYGCPDNLSCYPYIS